MILVAEELNERVDWLLDKVIVHEKSCQYEQGTILLKVSGWQL